jgi:hypothetical protein
VALQHPPHGPSTRASPLCNVQVGAQRSAPSGLVSPDFNLKKNSKTHPIDSKLSSTPRAMFSLWWRARSTGEGRVAPLPWPARFGVPCSTRRMGQVPERAPCAMRKWEGAHLRISRGEVLSETGKKNSETHPIDRLANCRAAPCVGEKPAQCLKACDSIHVDAGHGCSARDVTKKRNRCFERGQKSIYSDAVAV